jgi:hypothetical protein
VLNDVAHAVKHQAGVSGVLVVTLAELAILPAVVLTAQVEEGSAMAAVMTLGAGGGGGGHSVCCCVLGQGPPAAGGCVCMCLQKGWKAIQCPARLYPREVCCLGAGGCFMKVAVSVAG